MASHFSWCLWPSHALTCRAYNWHSVPQQLESVHKLLAGGYDFLHVLPGHGRAARLRDAAHREAELRALLEAEGWRPAAAG